MTNERKEEVKMLLDEHWDKISAIIPTLQEILADAPTEEELEEMEEYPFIDLYAEIANVVNEYEGME